MRNIPLIRRQLAGARYQSAVFVLCLALSLVTLVSLGGFSRSVHASFLRDARVLHAADIIVHSHAPFSPALVADIAAGERTGAFDSARVYRFYSVVRSARGDASLLAEIKAVEPGYPFYGAVVLASGRPFHETLTPGGVVVEQAMLDRFRLRIGDRIRIGNAVLTVRDVVLQEPDRPVSFFSLGPRVFVSAADLASLGLVEKGSRVDYTVLVKVRDPGDLEQAAARLKNVSVRDRERVETYRTAESGVKRFFDNFLFFLNLIGIFTLLLAGIGIQSSLAAFLKEQEQTIAIMKALGAGSRFITRHYFGVVAVLGLLGTVLGIGASFLLERFLPDLFQGLLPASMVLEISGSAVGEGLALGVLTAALFTSLPLSRLKEVRPRAIFGKQEGLPHDRRRVLLAAAAGALFFLIMVLWRIREIRTGLAFVIGMGLLVLIAALAAEAVLRLVRARRARSLVFRQALKGLFRPRNATRPVMITLTASLAVIFAIAVVERNLDASFVRSYPPDAPNLFFIDIQPSQKDDFARDLGMPAVYHPVVRAVITAVNGVTIDREQERRKRGDNLGREFSLTYHDRLLEDERVVEGASLFRSDWMETQVSVLDTVLKMRDLRIGDRITFRIQGVPVEARISSIRTRTRAAVQPFFYFVFPEKVLQDAPQTLFTAVRIGKERVAGLQNRMVARYPNVSVIDVTETVSVFARIMNRLSTIVGFFTLFSTVAGILLVVSSIIATRHARIQEAVFFTILGARPRFVLAVFAVESLFLGLASGAIALALSQAAGWFITTKVMDVGYQQLPGMSLLMVLAASALVVAVGAAASLPVIRHRPAAYLREHTDE